MSTSPQLIDLACEGVATAPGTSSPISLNGVVQSAGLNFAGISAGLSNSGPLTWSAAGAVNGTLYRYKIVDGSNCEICTGVYSTSGNSLTRNTIIAVVNGVKQLTPINATASAVICSTVTAEDIPTLSTIAPAVIPGGRLTLQSGKPVMTTNQVGISTIYYTPYKTTYIPLWNGASWIPFQFTEQSVALDTTNVLLGTNYDLFMFLNNGTPTLGYGPAWNNNIRTATISRQDGLWVNSASITLRTNSTTTFSVPAGQALYVGSFTGSANGSTAWAFIANGAGGNACLLLVYNAYNRIKVDAEEWDTTPGWTYNGSTWRFADGSFANRITWTDGLAETSVFASYTCFVQAAASGCAIGIELNWNQVSPPSKAGAGCVCPSNSSMQVTCNTVFAPTLGLNTINALEFNFGGTVNPTTFATSAFDGQSLCASLEM